MKQSKNKQIIVAVSGGFDPIHIGHVRMMQKAKKLGDNNHKTGIAYPGLSF